MYDVVVLVLWTSCSVDTEDLLTRMTIVGIVMAFRKLTLEAMNAVLSRRAPFILNVITSFHDNPPPDSPEVC